MILKQAPMLLSTVLTCTFFVTTTTAADFYVSWPDEAEPFTQLFVNGQRRLRARTPNEGNYFYTKRLKLTNARTPVCLGLTFFDDDLQPWGGLSEDARIVLFHNWVNSYNCIRDVNWQRRRVNFTRPAGALSDEGGARVRITDEQAASGRQSRSNSSKAKTSTTISNSPPPAANPSPPAACRCEAPNSSNATGSTL